MKFTSGLVAAATALSMLAPTTVLAQAKASKGQQMQNQASSEVPHCTRKLGTLSIVDGDDSSGWTQYNLASPQKVLRAIVQRSGCFNLVDRGAGLGAAEKERAIGGIWACNAARMSARARSRRLTTCWWPRSRAATATPAAARWPAPSAA